MSAEWYTWVIRTGKFPRVKKFIEEEVPEVLDIVYPQRRVERTYRGKPRIKVEAEFMNYMFVQLDEEDFEKVKTKFDGFSFITRYVGHCWGDELGRIEELKTMTEKRIQNPQFLRGDKVKIVGGPFGNFEGVVTSTKANEVVIEAEIFKRTTEITVPKENVDFI